MSKEKKKKKGGKKKGAKGGDEEPLTPEEQNTFLVRTVESLKHKLVLQTNKASSAEAIVRELQGRLFDLHKNYEQEKKNAFEIAADMTRQYKAMREKLLEKIDQLEVKLTVYLDKLDMAKLAKEDMIREHERQIAEKDQEIANREAKMDEMAQEFSNMLKSTLDKMAKKIVITNDWDGDPKEVPLVRTFEEFSIN